MQVVDSYRSAGEISNTQRLRLFHVLRPSIQKWRKTRFGKPYEKDYIDNWICNNLQNKNITVIDFGGWYLELFGYRTTCIESDSIAKQYWSNCYIESDLLINKPKYISENETVIFRNPNFLRYATYDSFINFLKVWSNSNIILNFDTRLVQHNYLKYRLLDLVTSNIDLNVKELQSDLWVING